MATLATYTAVKRFVAAIRPSNSRAIRGSLRDASGHQAQVDFARFVTVFEDEPGVTGSSVSGAFLHYRLTA